MRIVKRALLVLAVIALLAWLAFTFSVWPGAMLVRATFKDGGEQMHAGLVPFERSDVEVIANESYLDGDADALMDVYLPKGLAADSLLPVIVWTHGGGWIGGDKSKMRGYLMQLAAQGYAVVAVNYSRSPEQRYPTPLRQISAALSHLILHGTRLHADIRRVFLAGDSAGAQLTAQMAAIITDPVHAKEVDIAPALRPDQLRGLILHCGLYDMPTYVQRADAAGGFIGYAANMLPWAYLGEKRPSEEALRMISPIHQATAAFPPVFISGGNGDPLTAHQSRPMAARLKQLGLEVNELFFPDDHVPALPHEYQFTLSEPDAQTALEMSLAFLKTHAVMEPATVDPAQW